MVEKQQQEHHQDQPVDTPIPMTAPKDPHVSETSNKVIVTFYGYILLLRFSFRILRILKNYIANVYLDLGYSVFHLNIKFHENLSSGL